MPNKSQEIRIDELPEPFFQKTMEEVANHVVGFLRIEDTPRGQDGARRAQQRAAVRIIADKLHARASTTALA